MRLHALVEDLETARAAVAGGATVVQLRVKDASTRQLVELGRPLRELDAMFVVNDTLDVTGAFIAYYNQRNPASSASTTTTPR